MVAKLHVLKDLDNLSRRSSTYVAPECEKFFELPPFTFENNERTTKCFSIVVKGKHNFNSFRFSVNVVRSVGSSLHSILFL